MKTKQKRKDLTAAREYSVGRRSMLWDIPVLCIDNAQAQSDAAGPTISVSHNKPSRARKMR